MQIMIAFIAGLLMSIGIAVSMMIDPAKVLGFLNLSGNWDPSLALVMAAALAVYSVGFRLVRGRSAPLMAEKFQLPNASKIDKPILIGAAVFGLGWGLVGYCPGPALAALSSGSFATLSFVLAMVVGWYLARKWPLPH
ncbi:MAG: YeeE/YedE family protein [Alkalimonas sp.]|nr:YeeE/YedE family protein [Alkalimonas sp.]